MTYLAKDLEPQVRGDSWDIRLEITDSNGNPVNISGNKYTLTLKSDIEQSDAESAVSFGPVQPDTNDGILGIVNIYVPSAQTQIEPGSYYYDIQEVTLSGKVSTLMLGKVKVVKDITNDAGFEEPPVNTVSGINEGDMFVYRQAEQVWTSASPSELGLLTNVNIDENLLEGQLLQYTNGEWVNTTVTLSGGGGLSDSYIQSRGLIQSWGVTNGVNTGAFNAVMGTGGSATWLISGTSGGTFRAGWQVLDGGGQSRIYHGTDYLTLSGTGIVYHSGNFTNNSSNWNTAYSWGNHATAGYLKSYAETDPTVPDYVKNITSINLANWNTAYSWGNHATAGYIIDELDPTVPGHVKTITLTDKTNWNMAYSWGNHATVGYLTSFTESDPTVPDHVKNISTTDIANWNSGGSGLTAAQLATDPLVTKNLAPSLDGVPRANLGNPTIFETGVFDSQFTDKTKFHDATKLFVETSIDGITWVDLTPTSTSLKRLVGGDEYAYISIAPGTEFFRVRFVTEASGLEADGASRDFTKYYWLQAAYAYVDFRGSTCKVRMSKKDQAGNWVYHTNSDSLVQGQPAHVYLPFTSLLWSNFNISTHSSEVAVVFEPNWANLDSILLNKVQLWGGYPAGSRKDYSIDQDQNITFPGTIYASNITSQSITNWNTAYSSVIPNIISSPADNNFLVYQSGAWRNKAAPSSANWWSGTSPIINGSGVMEIARIVDFHATQYDTSDYGARLFLNGGNLELLGAPLVASGSSSVNWSTAYSWGNHATAGYATTSYVTTAISNLVDSAPGTLDTLNELAAALGDDPNFATTISTQIGTKWTQDNTKITNWDTAFSWGDHSQAGYALSSAVPVLTYPEPGNWYKGHLTVNSSGVTELGRYLDFHASDTTIADYDLRLYAQDADTLQLDGGNLILGSGGSITLFGTGKFQAGSGYDSTNWDSAYIHSISTHAPADADNTAANETSHADVVVDGDFASAGIMVRGATAGTYYTVLDGTNGQVLSTDGAGNYSFIDAASGGGSSSPATPTSAGTLLGFTADSISDRNVALGFEALNAVSVLTEGNVGIGSRAGKSITTGTRNLAIGQDALGSVTTGYQNVAMGIRAALGATGNNNFALGYEAFGPFAAGALTGSNNVALGTQALRGATGNLSHNVAIGHECLFTLANSSRDQNTAIGFRAGKSLLTGRYNTLIGSQAGINLTGGANYAENNIVIGYNAQASTTTISNEITLGNASITSLRCNVQTISSLSDVRDKTNVQDLNVGVDFIDSLRPVSFDWDRRDGTLQGAKDIGFIAQELLEAQQKLEREIPGLVKDHNPDRLEASYAALIPVMVKAIQELSNKVKELEAKL